MLTRQPFQPDVARRLLVNCPLVKNIIGFHKIDSTNSWLKSLIRQAPETADGFLAITEEQTAGRGRLNRHWAAPAGSSLLFSFALQTRYPHAALTMGIPLAVALALKHLFPALDPLVKWPNDILINHRKVCGILLEQTRANKASGTYIIAGIGLNISQKLDELPQNLRETATSLRLCLPEPADSLPTREEILATILNRIHETLQMTPQDICTEYNVMCHTTGRAIHLPDGRRGTAAGTDVDGTLLLKAPDGEILRVFSGEVGYLPRED